MSEQPLPPPYGVQWHEAPAPVLCSLCHGGDVYHATDGAGAVVDFCQACHQPCLVTYAEDWKRLRIIPR